MTDPEFNRLMQAVRSTLAQMEQRDAEHQAEMQRLRFCLRQVLDGRASPSVIAPLPHKPFASQSVREKSRD